VTLLSFGMAAASMRDSPHAQACNGYRNAASLYFKPTTLPPAPIARPTPIRALLSVFVKVHHGWKKHQKEYEALARTLINCELVALWKRCEEDSWRPKRTGIYDWKLFLTALKQELNKLKA
jgi:hypothetical protein